MASFALVFIKLSHRDADTLINEATIAFSKDFATFARSNNRADIESAVSALKKHGQDKAYGQAVTDGYKSANLVTGYIGAKSGKFSEQPADIQATFNDAITRFEQAFKQSLLDSGLFVNPTPKTPEEKAKAKEAKEAKAKEAKDAMITELVQSGELVRSVDVKKLEDFGRLALIEALKAQGFDVDSMMADNATLKAEHEALKAEHEALKAEHEALKAEHEALKASKKSKGKVTA